MAIKRVFAGTSLRTLRSVRGLRQSELAGLIGISASYLSQLENDDRPLTPGLIDRLRNCFPVEWQDAPRDQSADLLRAFEDAMIDMPERDPHSTAQVRRIVEQFPAFAASYIRLAEANRENVKRLEMLDEALGADNIAGGRLPWEEVRDWFHNHNNYIDTLDRAAEEFAGRMSGPVGSATTSELTQWLVEKGTRVRFVAEGPMRRFDPAANELTVNTRKTDESLRFHLAWHIASREFRQQIWSMAQDPGLKSVTAQKLLSVGLTNYAAGAILMPYDRFRTAARDVRHDVDRLRHAFGATFEQVCHRLSTLQRPNARGTPMFFCRVDLAGNITKRHSATRLRFARFGGACPLWVVHEAAALPDRIHVQLAQMPDGVRYVSMAKGLVKQMASYAQFPRRYALALGCEAEFAADFVYADELNLERPATMIGASCRTCSRYDCDQRAFPPNDRQIVIDADQRDVVPYNIVQ